MADDAGALLVRSGLVSSNALDDARARVASAGGTLGEQLVTNGAIGDDTLTAFYRSRLLVPQVNPNLLARLTPKVVGMLPGDMAIELRAIPVSIDEDNNLTVAMSDPSDRHAVDEIAFFTGAYVVRAVATQMQIAWCLAHYYGHVTPLGQRLLHPTERGSPSKTVAQRAPRTKGLTGKVNATRHRAIAPITGPVNVARPSSGQLDLRPFSSTGLSRAGIPANQAPPAPVADPAAARLAVPAATPHNAAIAEPGTAPAAVPASAPRSAPVADPGAARAAIPADTSPPAPVADPGVARATTPNNAAIADPGVAHPTVPAPAVGPAPVPSTPSVSADAAAPDRLVATPGLAGAPTPPPSGVPLDVPRAAPDAPTLRPIDDELVLRNDRPPGGTADLVPSDGAPDRPRGRSVSGEIRAPIRRAPSIRPPLPELDDDDEPLIVIERDSWDDDVTGPRMTPRRRVVKSDPPELYARAGEVDLKVTGDHTIADEPRIVIDEDALAPPTARIDTRGLHRDDPPLTTIDAIDDADTGALIHDRASDHESQPILLDRPRLTPNPLRPDAPTIPDLGDRPDDDTDETDLIVVLDARKHKPRPERRTQVGVPPPVAARPHRVAEASAIPTAIDGELERTGETDPTKIDLHAAPPGDETTSDQLAAPPAPASEYDTNPYVIAPPPQPAPPRASAIQRAVIIDDDDDDELDDDDGHDRPRGPRTSEMTAVELDDAIPERTTELDLGQRSRRRIDYDPVDDGWGPPGTTIPPPLLGAIPGIDDDDDEVANTIPMSDIDSSPLMVGPPTLPPGNDSAGQSLVRTLEDATARAIEVLHQLERANSRDEVVDVLVAYLAETHHRAGFFVTRHGTTKGATELGVFAMTPRPAAIPFATLRLDRPSTLQDVVGTRLPYRGPMHDDTSRGFLISVLGACPAEILLVPVAVRERVVGVLFGEHRQRHTFDDQLALAARAAGMALERILRAKRG